MSTPGSVFSPTYMHRSCSGMGEEEFFLASPHSSNSGDNNSSLSSSMNSSSQPLYPFTPLEMQAFGLETNMEQFNSNHKAAASTAAPIMSAFNFAPQTADRFVVDIATAASAPPSSSLYQMLNMAMPHHNPELLEGFLLDGGCATATMVSAASEGTTNSRKRKEVSASSSSSDETDDASQVLKKQRKQQQRAAKHGTSLVDSRSASPAATMGHSSPLLELLQQTNNPQSSSSSFTTGIPVIASTDAPVVAKMNKKDRAEHRRQKAALKLMRLEASIALLTAQVSHTKAQEAHAKQIANEMAQQAIQAANMANMHMAKQHSEMGMVDSFFASDEQAQQIQQDSSSSSLPPLSPVVALVQSSSFTSSSSSSSAGDELDLSECSSPTVAIASASRRSTLGSQQSDSSNGSSDEYDSTSSSSSSSPIQCLDDAIDAAMSSSSQCMDQTELVEHVRGLHWAEQARQMRSIHHAMQSIEQSKEVEMSSAALALRFIEEQMPYSSSSSQLRSTLQIMALEEQESERTAEIEMQESIKEFTSALLAKSHACVFDLPMRA